MLLYSVIRDGEKGGGWEGIHSCGIYLPKEPLFVKEPAFLEVVEHDDGK